VARNDHEKSIRSSDRPLSIVFRIKDSFGKAEKSRGSQDTSICVWERNAVRSPANDRSVSIPRASIAACAGVAASGGARAILLTASTRWR
jgi:hypothetical protein